MDSDSGQNPVESEILEETSDIQETVAEDDTNFWLKNPNILFDLKLGLFPTSSMSKTEKLNSVTRVVLLISIILLVCKFEYWYIFLIVSLFVILSVKYSAPVKEGFTVTPHYPSTDFQQTVVSPSYSSEYQIPPPAYDVYTYVPKLQTFAKPMSPQSYPYGQYLSRTNLLPSDEYHTHLLNGSVREARNYVNSEFLRKELAFRDNQSRIFKKALDRRFQNSCSDTYSPYFSY
jgi:Family of unknown function (DUF5762)